jgi:hypothetical protein
MGPAGSRGDKIEIMIKIVDQNVTGGVQRETELGSSLTKSTKM